MVGEKIERIYTVPLRNAYGYVRTKRTRRAVKLLREFIGRHMKAEEENIAISMALNNYVWSRSMQKPPRKVKVRLIKEDGKVKAYLADEKIEEKKPEPKKEEKKPGAKEEVKKPEEKKTTEEKKEEELKKEQTEKAEAAMAKKESEKAMKSEEVKIDIAEKKKMAHGKNTQGKQ